MENIYYVGDNALLENNDIKTSTIQECYQYCQDKKVLSIDIETTRKYNKYGDIEGLDPYTSKIVMFQIGDLDRQYVIDHRVVSIKLLLPLLTSNDIVKVGHNIKFEYKHILHNYNIKLVNVYDTQIVEQILHCGLKDIRFSLLELNKRYLNIQVDKSTRLEFLTIGSKPFTYRHIKYGAEDIINPLTIKPIQESEVLKKQLQNTVSLEMKFLPVLGDIEYKGMNFNKDKWLKMYAIKKPLLIVAIEKIENFITKNYANTKFVSNQLDLFNADLKCKILWSSPKQVISFFKHINGCPQEVSKQTKKLEYTVNAKLLASSLNGINKSQPDHIKQFIKDYINYKELEQSCTTFGPDYFKYINPITNRLHTNFNQILNTGRISSSNPNLQNIPSEDGYRQAFDVNDEHDIVNCDYSGQETVVLANVSKEPNIGNLIIQGGDMHCFVTKEIDPNLKGLSDNEIKSKHKDKRQIAKSAGLNKKFIDYLLLSYVFCILQNDIKNRQYSRFR